MVLSIYMDLVPPEICNIKFMKCASIVQYIFLTISYNILELTWHTDSK